MATTHARLERQRHLVISIRAREAYGHLFGPDFTSYRHLHRDACLNALQNNIKAMTRHVMVMAATSSRGSAHAPRFPA
jgi:hypothetical protein